MFHLELLVLDHRLLVLDIMIHLSLGGKASPRGGEKHAPRPYNGVGWFWSSSDGGGYQPSTPRINPEESTSLSPTTIVMSAGDWGMVLAHRCPGTRNDHDFRGSGAMPEWIDNCWYLNSSVLTTKDH